MKIGIVGAGVAGLSAAWAAAERGHEVHGFERFPMFHDQGSSHGRTRIVRRAYTDTFFTGLMTEAYPMWAEIESRSGQKLVDECGLLYFGDRDAQRVRSMITALELQSVPFSVLTPIECQARIPQLHMATSEIGVFTPEAGAVRADLALQTLHQFGLDAGVTWHQKRVDPHALACEFDAVIVTAGAWISDWIKLDITVTKQTFGYQPSSIPGPVWIDDTTLAYGFPSDEWGMKIGAHAAGPSIQPTDARDPDAAQIRQIEETLRTRFRIEKPDLQRVTTCLYTSTPDEQFRMGWLDSGVLFSSACSGHGFKLGPWIGRKLVSVLEGEPIPNEFRWPK